VCAGYGEGRVERETGLGCGIRLVESTKLGRRGGQVKVCDRIISVGFDRSAKPRNGSFIIAEKGLRIACKILPCMGIGIARAEAQRLADMSLRLFGATDENFAESDKGMGAGKVSILAQDLLKFLLGCGLAD
jgi:hypothetical protein